VASSGESLGGSKLLPFKNDGGHCSLFFNAAERFWYPSPDICLGTILSWSSTDKSFDLMAWFLLRRALSTVSPFIDVCVFPNHVQSIEFTTGGLQ
jgi:hypothetical protein